MVNRIVGSGANHVTIVNLPDASQTRYALAQSSDLRSLIGLMIVPFNQLSAAGLDRPSAVLLVDASARDRK